MLTESGELTLQVEILAGIVADMDEDNLHVLDASENILEKIEGSEGIGPDVDSLISRALSVIGDIKSDNSGFESRYAELCELVNQISRSIDDSESEDDRYDEDTEEINVESKEEASFEIEKNIPTMPENDIQEFDNQLEVLECLVDDIAHDDSHVLGVVSEIFKKIGRIPTFPDSHTWMINESSEIIKMIQDGGNFKLNLTKIKLAVTELKSLLDLINASENKTDSESVSDTNQFDSEILKHDREAILNTFVEQQPALLEDLEMNILDLEKGKHESFDEIRRYIHTLKGETGVLGLRGIHDFLHELESRMHSAEYVSEKEKITALLSVKDYLYQLIAGVSRGKENEIRGDKAKEILDAFGKPLKMPEKRRKVIAESTTEVPSVHIDMSNPELVDFVSETNEYLNDAEVALMGLEKNPDDSHCLNEMFRVFHNIKGISGFLNLRDVNELAHNAENLLDEAREGRISFSGGCADAAYDAIDMFREMTNRVGAALNGAEYAVPDGYLNLLMRLKSPDSVDDSVSEAPEEDIKPVDIEIDGADKDSSEITDKKDTSFKEASSQEKSETTVLKKVIVDGMVKVSTVRLDNLIDAVGELVISNAMVSQEPEIQETDNARLSRNVSQLGKITRELQELAMSMRMVSLGGTFHKMARVARDLSVKSGIQVDFTFSGEDTELDRNVVDEIGSPLVHMVRNSMDHGIEKKELRKMLGKPEKGKIHLSAYHEGGNVVIKIEDDGKGLDRDVILEKAENSGLVKAGQEITDKEVYGLIFKAGFSTAKKVTDVSGRGVGMDVVRKSIENLRGRIDIETQSGKGTTFFIRLPLTLAIIDGMVITSGNEKYIIPTLVIEESLRPVEGQVKTVVEKGEMLVLRGDMIPVFQLPPVNIQFHHHTHSSVQDFQ